MLRGVFIGVVVVAIVSSPVVGATAAADNEPPLATAGLDQTVDQGQRVYLDAGGSVDPDGEITEYEWTIKAPNGTTMEPDCTDCEQTRFRPNQTGTYEVTVAVTDDDGATREDTLSVTVNAVEPPTVSVSGPGDVETGETATVQASVTAGDGDLQRVTWYRNGTRVESETLAKSDATPTISKKIDEGGTHEFVAEVTDELGMQSQGSHVVRATSTPESSNTETSDTQSSNSDLSGNSGPSSDGSPRNTQISRLNGDDTYRIRVKDDGTVSRGDEVLFTEQEVQQLDSRTGVEMKTSNEGWNTESDQIVITNEKIKEDIDKDTGSYGNGFKDENPQYTNPDSEEYGPNHGPDSAIDGEINRPKNNDDDSYANYQSNGSNNENQDSTTPTDTSVESSSNSDSSSNPHSWQDEYDNYTEYYRDNHT